MPYLISAASEVTKWEKCWTGLMELLAVSSLEKSMDTFGTPESEWGGVGTVQGWKASIKGSGTK